jgi:hypothetical protein
MLCYIMLCHVILFYVNNGKVHGYAIIEKQATARIITKSRNLKLNMDNDRLNHDNKTYHISIEYLTTLHRIWFNTPYILYVRSCYGVH